MLTPKYTLTGDADPRLVARPRARDQRPLLVPVSTHCIYFVFIHTKFILTIFYMYTLYYIKNIYVYKVCVHTYKNKKTFIQTLYTYIQSLCTYI